MCAVSCDAYSAIPSCIQDNARIACDECKNTSRTPHASRITNVWRYRGRLCVRLRDAVASMGLKKERITSAMNCIFRSSQWKEVSGMSVISLFFQTTLNIAISYCMWFMISRLYRTQSAETILSITCLIWCASNSFAPTAMKTPSWMWFVDGAVLGSTVEGPIPSLI